MMLNRTVLLSLFLLVFIHITGYGQDLRSNNRRGLEIKGSVVEKESGKPIANVNVSILGGRFTQTDNNGRFNIKARVGDELLVEHHSFQTAYYTIRNDEDIKVYVKEDPLNIDNEMEVEEDKAEMRPIPSLKKSVAPDLHRTYNDSAEFYKKNDIARSILFVEKGLTSLGKRKSDARQAESFAVLGDIYF